MKKIVSIFFLFLAVAGFTNFFQPSICSAYEETVETGPDLSSLPILPYDFRGPYRGTVYLKNRVVFKNINGEYMAFDVEDGAKTGLNLVWWNKWTIGYRSLLPNTPLIYASFTPGSSYNAYKLIDGEWVYQNYVTDGNSFDFYAEWVLAPGIRILYSTLDLINANGQIFSYELGEWIDGTFEECRENSIYSAKDYDFALPVGLYANIPNGSVITARTNPSPKYICEDGIDNDADGFVDENDPSCHTDWDVNNPASYNPRARSENEDNIKRLPIQDNGTEMSAGSGQSTFSGDGKLIAYASVTYTGGWYNNTRVDVFLYNTTTGVNERINLAPDGGDANGQSSRAAISNDGSYVAFESSATNLVSDKTDGSSSDIFLRDLTNNTTILVSRGLDGEPAGHSSNSSIGGENGRYISFESEATNLVPDDTNGRPDVFVYNIDTKEIKCASLTPDGSIGDGYSNKPFLSSAGDFVVFSSTSTNLVTGDTNGREGRSDIFVRDLNTDETERVSLSWDGKETYGSFNEASISPDGRYVSFYSPGYYLFPDDTERWSDTFVYDRTDKSLERISVSADGQQGNSDSYQASMSAGGQYAVFSSYADNLVAGDTNAIPDVFIRNQSTNEIKILSSASDGTQGNNQSYPSGITPDGKYILMISFASNLVKGDLNNATDTFIVKNPFEKSVEAFLSLPTDLQQRNESDGSEVGVGKIINEGAAESADSIILSAKVENPDGGSVALEVQIESVDEVSGEWTSFEPLRSEYVQSGEVATIDYNVPKGGLYTWRAKTVNEEGGESDWSHFGDNGIEADFISSNFTFVHLTDVHLGSLTTIATSIGGENWYESQSYPRFTDVLYEIENLDPRPDFILIGGDNVEYNNERWLYDFKAIIDGYSERTGIEIYVVPGNHDRYDSESSAWSWEEKNFSGGNDYLKNFLRVMDNPDNTTSLLENMSVIDPMTQECKKVVDLTTSGGGGFNRYNYYFEHKGFQFIGLDSGEDIETGDLQPEGGGVNESVMENLTILVESFDVPRIIFMHHPVYANQEDPPYNEWGGWRVYKDQSRTDTGEIAEDGAIVHNWRNFIDLCNNNDVQLILSGHTHDSVVFNSSDEELNLATWVENKSYPLYLQTQSAGKGDDHGYRIINVKNGKAIPQEAVTGVKKYEKVYTDLNAESDLNFRAYSSDGNEITMENSNKSTMFLAENSDRRIIYDDTEKSHFDVENNNSFESSYDLHLQKREEWAEPSKLPESVYGYHIHNAELCSGDASYCNGFLAVVEGGDYRTVYFEDIKIKEDSSQVIFVDWNDVKVNWGGFSTKVEGISFGVNGDYNNLYSYDKAMIAVDLNSPGELRVYYESDEGNEGERKVTGMVDGEIVEDIPYSIYVPESETVYIFGDTREEIADGLKTQVVGAYEATYDLSISLSENDEETAKFIADDILINNQTTHQFSVDWEALEQGEDGVTMEFDENKDGEFEKFIVSDESLSFPKAQLDIEKYSANEGMEIVFDGSASSDSDGNIILYEWDFDGDGAYDADSVVSTMSHIYGDDYEGKIFLRVTDNENLESVSSAAVSVANANPTAEISRFEMADIVEDTIIGKKSTNSGWHGGAHSSSEIVDTIGEFILEGGFTDSGWL
ncbi:MAG: metallophosphoesterase, partial [Candidatus Paceibacterota bacterium]